MSTPRSRKHNGQRDPSHAITNSAQNDKDSILVETKLLLQYLHEIRAQVPKVFRMYGAFEQMRQSALTIIREFYIGREFKEERVAHIKVLMGEYGVLVAMFEECCNHEMFTDTWKYNISCRLDRMEEGIKKWRNATRSLVSQVG